MDGLVSYLASALDLICCMQTTTITPWTVAILIALIVPSCWYVCCISLSRHKTVRRLFDIEGAVPHSLASFWTVGNVTTLLFYYVQIFNPLNTYKPPWTEYLG